MENNNNKGQTIFLSVVGVATLLVALVGATFAFFSTQMTGAAGQQSITTATVSQLLFSSTGFEVPAQDILPGKVIGERSFAVRAESTISQGINISYDCFISSTLGSITDLEYRVSAADTDLGPEVGWTAVPAEKTSLFAQEKPSLSSANTDDTYHVELRFKETGVSQNEQQGQTANVSFACELANGTTVFYNDANPSGTTENIQAQ